jgi:hypothetical protein
METKVRTDRIWSLAMVILGTNGGKLDKAIEGAVAEIARLGDEVDMVAIYGTKSQPDPLDAGMNILAPREVKLERRLVGSWHDDEMTLTDWQPRKA